MHGHRRHRTNVRERFRWNVQSYTVSVSMSRVQPDELPGSMVTLGLVIEMPDQTVKHIGSCLGRRFRRSNFSRSTAHSAVLRLADQGCVRRTYTAPGIERSSDRYVPTSEGRQVFRAWMYDVSRRGAPGPGPALREAMYGRIELCKLEDIPRLLELAREEEQVSADLYDEASKRLTNHTKTKKKKGDPRQRVRDILMYVEPLHWSARAERYQLIVEALEEVLKDMREAGVGVGDG
jgi:hypothetical protein